MSSKRGIMIVIEGLDCVGKTTQAKKLFETLRNQGKKVELIRFPDRTTITGNLIDKYLNGQTKLNDHVIHLLFTANRWEKFEQMTNMLKNGTTLIIDRYSYSGVAYTAAKGLDFDWCRSPEKGLIKPDCVLFLTTNINNIMKRENFGQEIYERKEFQQSVYCNYQKMIDSNYWSIIDTTDKSIEDVHNEIIEIVDDRMKQPVDEDLSYLW